MPNLAAVPGFSSTLSLTIFTLPLSDLEISSNAGAIMRHGPHHSAQKSTTTGSVALSTWASKSASETLPTPMGHLDSIHLRERANPGPRRKSEPMDGGGERQGKVTRR